MNKKKISLRNGLLFTIILCWLVPILIILSLSGALLNESYESSALLEIENSAGYAMRQSQYQLQTAIDDSKAVSYDGTIYNAYRQYMDHRDSASLYRAVNEYMNRTFSRSKMYKATLLSFWDESIGVNVYTLGSGTTNHALFQECRSQRIAIVSRMQDADTDIRFLLLDGQLYLARNLLDGKFRPYATVGILLDPNEIFRTLSGLSRIEDSCLTLDTLNFSLGDTGLIPEEQEVAADVNFSTIVDGHQLVFAAKLTKYSLWSDNPWLGRLIALVAFMVLPLGAAVYLLFRQHVTRPAEVLAQANQLVQSGNRGYKITRPAPNMEFKKLYDHFNDMSGELKTQFDRSYQEQQELQQAQIKALQSQINPHFLNNTLEIINWEARIAENDRVSAMIEALSTMLAAALDRKGRSQIPLEEELSYVDAYLYIIRQRLGDNFKVYKKIDDNVLQVLIPRLVLQPIVENAVDHDMTERHGGEMWVRAFQRNQMMVVEVEHEGTLTQEDQEKIDSFVNSDQPGARVGIRNVSQRLRLLYGPRGKLEIVNTDRETIIARITYPAHTTNQFAERSTP